ncbi:glycosyltransferase family 4 protein [Sphingomonas nostoxanthinifaciens]|uniref:glycosyltransferase family 4 protein n=1 Tax=Sphingomonas nostoxanthinifaciens TaxID=2872652 RepID=UPI001CC2040E|nr:glycosyltransferase family 1 protein [Sphingomonas nostoxanthinifaciens]UAK23268.1 glycosyltransferase family 4 protein [Sphingomonas nostoxanthinifaciens]
MTPIRSIQPSRPIFLNGKFYLGVLNGVHRVADCLVRALDERISARPPEQRPAITLLLPRDCPRPEGLQTIEIVSPPGGRTQLWEQTALAWTARSGVLVSLCNLGPLAHPRQITLIHDAQFWLPEQSYPLKQRWGYRLLIPLVGHTSRRVLTVSRASRQQLELTRIVRPGRTGVIYNGGDHVVQVPAAPDALARFGLKPGGYALLFGSTKTYKNLEVIRAAMEDGMLGGVPLVIVGHDINFGGFDGAICTGAIDDGILRGLYEGATCLLFPSRTEGFGLPPVEAMLLGCPVVAAPAGALPEICRDAVLYADVDDPTAWGKAVRALASDPELRAAKIAAGRERAAHFTWGQAADRLLDEAETMALS